MKYFLYVLTEPNSDIIRYVGITRTNLAKRLTQHCSDRLYKKNNKKIAWLKRLYNNNQKPDIKMLDCDLSKEEACLMEVFYIKYFKLQGFNLVNGTSGGETGFVFSEDAVQKIRDKNKNRVVTEETRRKLSLAHSGKKQSPETIAKRVASCKGIKRGGWKLSEEICKKMSVARTGVSRPDLKGKPAWNKGTRGLLVAWNKGIPNKNKGKPGKKHTYETKMKMSASKMGKPTWNTGLKTGPMSEEIKNKISEGNKGKVYSEESLAKMSASAKKRRYTPEGIAKITEVRIKQGERARAANLLKKQKAVEKEQDKAA